jgi:hypothetical protein
MTVHISQIWLTSKDKTKFRRCSIQQSEKYLRIETKKKAEIKPEVAVSAGTIGTLL